MAELVNYIKAARGLADIERLLATNAISIDYKDIYGNTALHYCSEYDEGTGLRIADLLILHNADVNACNNYGQTVLIKFIKDKRSVEFIRLLLISGADVNCKDVEGNTALHYVPAYDCDVASGIVESLFEHRLHVNARNMMWQTPLMKFVKQKSDISLIRTLIDKGASVDCRDREGNTVLHLCSGYGCSNSDIDIVKKLIDCEVDINRYNNKPVTALMKFIWYGCNVDILKALLIAGADCRSDFDDLLFVSFNPYCNAIDDLKLLFKYTLLLDERIWRSYSATIKEYKNASYYNALVTGVEESLGEISLLKGHRLIGNFTLYDFCTEKNNRKLGMYYPNYNDMDTKNLMALFPCYYELIGYKMDVGKQWYNILCDLENISLSSRSKKAENTILLNNDCLLHVTGFLSKRDLINLINAAA